MSNCDYDSIKLEKQMCFPLYAASREVVKQYRPYLDALNLTYTQYITMMVMWEEKRISVKELGKKLFLDSGTMTPVLKNLEKKGFILRYRSKNDERILEVEITESGEKLKESAASVPENISKCIKINADEAVQLYQTLYKILRLIKGE